MTCEPIYQHFLQDMVSVKKRIELFEKIDDRMRDHLGFSASAVYLASRSDLLHNFLPEAGGPSAAVFKTDVKGVVIRAGIPAIAEGLVSADVLSIFLQEATDGFFCQGLVIHLFEDGRFAGYWVFLFSGEAGIGPEDIRMLRALGDQLLLAVLRIKALEAIKEQEMEWEILQTIHIDLASIRDKRDLSKIIHFRLKELFEFGHQWVAVISEDQHTMSCFLQDTNARVREHPKYQSFVKEKHATDDKILNRILLSKAPHVIDMESMSDRSSLPDYMQILYESGAMRVVMTGLQVGSRIVGCWAICLSEGQYLDERQLSLVKSISNQLSVAVDNIQINESIKKRESEQELLLKLSYEMTTIRDEKGLIRVINQNLRKIIEFETIVILMMNKDGSKYSFLYSSGELYDQSGARADGDTNINSYSLDCLATVLDSEDVLIYDMEVISSHPLTPSYLKFEYENGILEKVVVPLREESRALGVLCINSTAKGAYSAHDLELIKGISYQMSTAISNILANKEIEQREQEKSKLLSFSNAIASVPNKFQLAKVLKQQLLSMFGIQDFVIHSLSADKSRHTPIIFDPAMPFASHPDFTKLLNRETDVNDGVFNVVLASEDPVFFNVEEWNHMSVPPPYIEAAKLEGLKHMVGVALRFGQENIAVMNFRPEDYNKILSEFKLFKSILSQIGIAISNIIANEQVNKQLIEIDRYKQQLEEEKIYLKEEIETAHNYAEILGDSPAMQKVFRLLTQVAPSDSTVLVLGETGTGKELIARAIHNNSPRKHKLMVKVNCAALPANLIESELFGHERGSFTGATERRLGKFELANGGTLFLDEIGEMPLDLQVKLLRALQEREIERVGGKGVIKVDVRIIAATNRDLEKEMMEGRFRSDLYYRLNIFPISLPSLRERREDIPLLTSHFISRYSKKAGKKIDRISNNALQDMMRYDWPGNIRELEHLLERSVLLASESLIKNIYLPSHKAANLPMTEQLVLKTIDENERDHIRQILKHCKGRIGGYMGAAELLGVPPSTLFSKMKKLGIKRDFA